MSQSNLAAHVRLMLVASGAVSGTAILMQVIFISTRLNYCLSADCTAENSRNLPETIIDNVSISQCEAASVLLSRGSSRAVRDKILLLGDKNSVSEYILPIMHLSKYDPTLTDSSYARQGLSAVKYGIPINIANPQLRLALYNLGLADAVILSQDKLLKPIDSMSIRYQFRLQPFKTRIGLPKILPNVGISEDSEVVASHIERNRDLFDLPSYSCP